MQTGIRYKTAPYETLYAFCGMLFEKYGFTVEESRLISDVLLDADLCGIESHGIQRLVRYDREIRDGLVDIGAALKTIFETPISAVMDANKAMGQVAAAHAMALAIRKAQSAGIGMVTVRNSNHFGIAGYYTRMAAKEDLIGICMTNTEAIMVPTFGRKAMLGTNPIAVAMPAEGEVFSFDASTTVVPRGKLEVYRKRGEPVPEGWMLDAEGQDTTDTGNVLDNIIGKRGGGILPLGGSGEERSGYKGYGFGLVCELFTGILSGGVTSSHIYETPGSADIAHCFMAMDYGLFGCKQEIRTRFSQLLDELRLSDKALGQNRIYIHGEKEAESRTQKLRDGIPFNEKTWGEMRRIAEDLGVAYINAFGEAF